MEMEKAWKIIQNIESNFQESNKNSGAKKQSAVHIIFSMPREIFDKHAPIIAKYDNIVCNTYLIKVTSGQISFIPGFGITMGQWYRTCKLEDFQDNKKLEKFKISVWSGNKVDTIRQYLSQLNEILRVYIKNQLWCLHLAYSLIFEIYYGINIKTSPRSAYLKYLEVNFTRSKFNKSACRKNLQKPIQNDHELSKLFQEPHMLKFDKITDAKFDICAALNVIDGACVFSKELKCLARDVRKVRNDFAHNMDDKSWTGRDFEKSMKILEKFSILLIHDSLKGWNNCKNFCTICNI